ncbi:uncharacterized protein LOC125779940 [Bactrocera dorsalis]|uniref:Uncharacterized protein LOC125779930 n=1 Tax=Bactrocera dorsalis TaxID=27457 RepID=A0ABM3K6H9_BACDO|nr:uncharacterized protein LOC125779930 [Bactrocera dorsalis]XP_049317095.1 uncharacterized protein LOC125779940 [Bactrocera dorsalis]
MRQKNLMVEYILRHQDLAKNMLPNCGQGKAAANKLWDSLAVLLNAAGPPMKDAKSWRKVFADQKHNVKKKLSFNKASKQRTGGGPYEEKYLTTAEEQLLQATGMDVAVEGLGEVRTFGNSTPEKEPVEKLMAEFLYSGEDDVPPKPSTSRSATKRSKQDAADEKLALIKENMIAFESYQQSIGAKLDKLIALKERSMEMKKEAHKAYMEVKAIELQINRIQLEALKENK